MEYLFEITYDFLKFLENITGFSYREINIIIWFIIIPFTWALLIDKILSKHFLKIGFTLIACIALFLINDFSKFSNWLFAVSYNFLNIFNIIGSNYITSSVIICVLIPILVYIFLIRKAYFSTKS